MILVALSDHCYGYEMILCGWTIHPLLNFTLSLWVIYLWVFNEHICKQICYCGCTLVNQLFDPSPAGSSVLNVFSSAGVYMTWLGVFCSWNWRVRGYTHKSMDKRGVTEELLASLLCSWGFVEGGWWQTSSLRFWPLSHKGGQLCIQVLLLKFLGVAFWPVTCCHVSCYMSYWIPLACTDLMQNVLHS
jgi:hypothetical protein